MAAEGVIVQAGLRTERQAIEEALGRIAILRGLSAREVSDIAPRFHWHRYKADEQILTEEDEDDLVYFILDGRVRVVSYSQSGKEVIYRDMLSGDVFGELAAIDGKPRSANVVAVSDTLVATLSGEAFRTLVAEHSEVAQALLRKCTGLIRVLTERVFEFSALAVRNRIHAELLRLADNRDPKTNTAIIKPAPRHAEIASRVSTHREAVTREISALAKAGVLEKRNSALLVNDLARLRDLVEHPQDS